MRAANIRHLSISLEALARIQGADELFQRVHRLLDHEISLMEDDHTTNKPNTPNNDEIPF